LTTQTELDDTVAEQAEARPSAQHQRKPQKPQAAPLTIAELNAMHREGLMAVAEQLGLEGASTLRKQDLIFRLLQTQAEARGNVF
jgi:transcription termination factor Rho